MAQKKGELIVGLDIGTTKICCIVGEVTPDGIDVVGIGTQPSRGLRKGVVINIDATVASIRRAVEEAELMAGCEISSVYAGIAGGHIRGFNSQGVVAVKDKEVRQGDIDRVLDAARAINIPQDREILHVLPQEYLIDEQDGIREPLGMSGVRLEAKVHIVTGAVTSAQNIIKCCAKTNLSVAAVVLESLASAEAVVAEEEKELGVALVDIGGGTTDIAIFCEGAIVHTSVLPLGGNHLTNDVAVGLRTPLEAAEKIKQRYGCALTSLIDAEEMIEVPSVGGRAPRLLARQVLVDIMMPRMEEIFEQVRKEIARAGYEDLLASGIVLTGGATSLEGSSELAEEVLGMQVRRGVPRNIGGLTEVVKSPGFATGVGLVQYGARAQRRSAGAAPPKGMWRRMRTWIGEIF